MSRELQGTIQTPREPRESDPRSVFEWAKSISRVLQTMHREYVNRIETMILAGDLDERPSARGTRRLYYARDTGSLYIDDQNGWVKI